MKGPTPKRKIVVICDNCKTEHKVGVVGTCGCGELFGTYGKSSKR